MRDIILPIGKEGFEETERLRDLPDDDTIVRSGYFERSHILYYYDRLYDIV